MEIVYVIWRWIISLVIIVYVCRGQWCSEWGVLMGSGRCLFPCGDSCKVFTITFLFEALPYCYHLRWNVCGITWPLYTSRQYNCLSDSEIYCSKRCWSNAAAATISQHWYRWWRHGADDVGLADNVTAWWELWLLLITTPLGEEVSSHLKTMNIQRTPKNPTFPAK